MRRWLLLALLALAAVLAVRTSTSDTPELAGAREAPVVPAHSVRTPPRRVTTRDALRLAERRQWQERVEQARRTLEAYRDGTRYPPECSALDPSDERAQLDPL